MPEHSKSTAKRRYARDRKPSTGTETKPSAEKVSAPRRQTKIGGVIARLEGEQGATVD